MKRREHGVGVAALGPDGVEPVDGEQAGVHVERHRPAERGADLALAAPRERTDVGAEVHRLRPGLRRERGQLAPRRAVAQEQAAAPLPQPRVELGQALEQELGPGARGVPPVQQTIVEAEHGHDRVRGVERRPQRGVVVQAQVATQPQDGDHGSSNPATAAWR